ncbi:hypothetical protein ACQHIV_13065 [Kribbella sp. GL6]|uniref:hypothetical protein n=1 Tax=Kribbella sp. GL6 TaxID=3419765 RepID=UPI003CFEDBEC
MSEVAKAHVPPEDESDVLEAALQHGWSWFSLHAVQRMQVINHYLVAVAFLTAAYGSLAAARHWMIAAAVATTGVVVSLVFDLLDSRTRELIGLCEPALSQLEERLSREANVDLMMVLRASKPHRRRVSYRVLISTLTRFGLAAFAIGVVVAVIQA